MRSDTFLEDQEILEWAEKLSKDEAHEREADNRMSIIIIVICFAGIVIGMMLMGG